MFRYHQLWISGKLWRVLLLGWGGEGRGEVSRGRMKIMGEREQRRQEDIRNALKMREEWQREKQEKQALQDGGT